MNCLQQNTENQPEILTKEENEAYQKERQKLLKEKQLEKLKLELNSKLFKETEVYEWRCIEKFTGFFVNPKHTKSVKKCEKKNKDKKQKNNEKNGQQQKEQNQDQYQQEEKTEDEIKILDPIIELNDNSYQWIHTYECGFQNEEIIVLLHGYAGCAMTYVRGLKQLAQKYHVFAIDMLGFGMSSRPNFNITDPQKIIEYMVDSIEKWRLQMIPDKKFNLCGHSYGGYISAMYGIKYAQHLKNLILLSPIGTTEYSQDQVQEREKQMLQNFGFTKKILFSKIKSSYSERTGPTRWLNKFYMPTNYIIGRYFSKRLGLPKEEVDLWQKFMRQQFKFNESTEKGFFDLFLFPVLAAKFPLCQELLKLKDQKVPVHFMYGQYDWMDQKGAKQIYKDQKIECTYTIIEGAGHQIVFEQPEIMAQKLIQIQFPQQNSNQINDIKEKELLNKNVKKNIKNNDMNLALAKYVKEQE